MTTHTPGPWFYHEPINSKRKDFGVTAVRPYDPSRGAVRRIAWVGNASNPASEVSEEVRANARLIAAAPDMLNALKRAEEWLEGWGSAEPQLAIIRAAISKAESA